jgi:hypothetical protein
MMAAIKPEPQTRARKTSRNRAIRLSRKPGTQDTDLTGRTCGPHLKFRANQGCVLNFFPIGAGHDFVRAKRELNSRGARLRGDLGAGTHIRRCARASVAQFPTPLVRG